MCPVGNVLSSESRLWRSWRKREERLNDCGRDRDGEVGRVTFTSVDTKSQAAVSAFEKDWNTFAPLVSSILAFGQVGVAVVPSYAGHWHRLWPWQWPFKAASSQQVTVLIRIPINERRLFYFKLKKEIWDFAVSYFEILYKHDLFVSRGKFLRHILVLTSGCWKHILNHIHQKTHFRVKQRPLAAGNIVSGCKVRVKNWSFITQILKQWKCFWLIIFHNHRWRGLAD